MLTQVVLQTANPMVLDIDSVDPSEILIIKSISGLSPADVNLFTGDFARDGGYYQGRRVVKRNPVITFQMNPDYAGDIRVSDIREMLYQQFLEPSPGSDGVKVLLKDDRKPDRYFIGYTEKIESNIFSAETEAQVSMICVDPYLRSDVQVNATDAAGWVSKALTYEGSASTGLYMKLLVKTATNTVTVDLNGTKMVLVNPSGNFAINDVIEISTTIGSRYIKRNGTDIMAMLTSASKWLAFDGAANTIKIYSTVEGDGKVVMTQYTYRDAWWGI